MDGKEAVLDEIDEIGCNFIEIVEQLEDESIRIIKQNARELKEELDKRTTKAKENWQRERMELFKIRMIEIISATVTKTMDKIDDLIDEKNEEVETITDSGLIISISQLYRFG